MGRFKKISVILFCFLLLISLTACSAVEKPVNTNPQDGKNDWQAKNNGNGAAEEGDKVPGKGGGTTGSEEGSAGKNVTPDELREWNGVKGKILTGNYPAEVEQYIETNKSRETQKAMNVNNRTYIVLTMGERRSAGYVIELKDVVLKDGILKVFAKYEKPGKNDIVATVITYPTLVLELDDIYEGHYTIEYDIEQ